MDMKNLVKWGKRSVIAGLVLMPFDIAIVIAFIVLIGDPIGAFSLTMSLLALSAVLIGFGAAAISSAKAENLESQQSSLETEAEQVPVGELPESNEKQ